MALQPPSARQEMQNKKILEELQMKKQLLLKQGAANAVNISNASSVAPSYGPSESHITQRAHMQMANTQSFGSFVPQDSLFGNFILPVLPRFDK